MFVLLCVCIFASGINQIFMSNSCFIQSSKDNFKSNIGKLQIQKDMKKKSCCYIHLNGSFGFSLMVNSIFFDNFCSIKSLEKGHHGRLNISIHLHCSYFSILHFDYFHHFRLYSSRPVCHFPNSSTSHFSSKRVCFQVLPFHAYSKSVFSAL